MATRTVTVRLRADISHYTRGMRTAARSTSDMAGAGAAVSTVLLAGFAAAAAAAAKFDKELSNVRAVTQGSASDMAKLRAAALEAGKTTSFTATEAARAEAELARAGIKVADIVGGALKGSLALAAAGQVSLSEAAVTSAQAMNTFGLKGKDVTHIADLLAAGANKSAADVHGLAMSMRMGGLLAHQTGLSIEDTVGVLSAFADHALIGSDAGTSLKVMLQRLVPQSKEAKGAMEAINFSAYDARGNFVGLTEMAERMKNSFAKLTPEARNSAMATIFGADAVRSATILYELGGKGIESYIRAVDDQGAAQRMAATQTDNLIGDIERLKGALEVALIEGGSAANGALRNITKSITSVVNAYNSLPPGVQHAVTLVTGFTGAVGLAGIGLLLLLPRIAATRVALASMGVTAARAGAAMRIVGQVGAVIGALAALSYASEQVRNAFADAPPSTAKMGAALVQLGQKGKAAGELTKTFGQDLDGFGDAVKRLAHPSWENRTTDIVNDITFDLTEGIAETDIALKDARERVKSVDEALGGLVTSGHADVAAKAFDTLAASALEQGTSVEKLKTLLPGYTDALANTSVQQQLNGESQAALSEQLAMTTDDLGEQKSAAEQLGEALKGLNGIAISAAEGEIGFRDSLANLTEKIKDNGRSMSVTSAKGREVKTAYLEAAKGAMEHAQAVAEQKGSFEAGQAVLTKDISLLRETMSAAGYTKEEIDKLTEAFLRLPADTTVKIGSPGAVQAAAEVQALRGQLGALKPGKTITIKAPTAPAVAALRAAGYAVEEIPGTKNVKITAPTGTPIAAALELQRVINNLRGRTVNVFVNYKKTGFDQDANGTPDMIQAPQARGSVLDFYAGGGLRENHVAQIAPAGSWRIWGEPETQGEGYVPFAPSKRVRSRAITEEIVRRLGGKGVAWANGGINYTPSGMPDLGGPGAGLSRYNELVGQLRDAWKEYRSAIAELNKVKHDKKATNQERREAAQKVAATRGTVFNLDAKLGLARGAQAPTAFNLNAYQKQLSSSLRATQIWRNNLNKIAGRGGQDLRDLLEGMGEEGAALVNKLAGASTKQFNMIASQLKATAGLAKATLADFTQQLDGSTKQGQQFAKDLQTLAARGFGDLAQVLAAQGDASAIALAREAVGNSKSAAKANASVKTSESALSGEDLTNALILLSTLRAKPGSGFAELIAAGLEVSVIRSLVPRIMGQINSLPAANKGRLLQQMAGQNSVVGMARGGILDRAALVLGGEAGVRESWIPHDGSARSRSLLAATAATMGYQLTPVRRYGGGAGGSAAPQGDRYQTVNLYGAKQSSAEQAADVARHLSFIG